MRMQGNSLSLSLLSLSLSRSLHLWVTHARTHPLSCLTAKTVAALFSPHDRVLARMRMKSCKSGEWNTRRFAKKNANEERVVARNEGRVENFTKFASLSHVAEVIE